jgi:4-carboxymuconolactone decarboxylase
MSAGVKVAKTSRDPSAVASVIRYALRAGSESRYEAWFREVTTIGKAFPRHSDLDFIRPLRRVAIGDSRQMDPPDFTNPREAARPFTPKLSALSESPLYDKVWEDSDLSKRDRSLITVAALVCLGRMDEFPAHLHRAIGNGVTETELAAAITHLAFYAGFPAAISASVVANGTLRQSPK